MGESDASQVNRETLAFEYWIANTVQEVSDRDSALSGFQAGVTWHRILIKHDLRITELAKKPKASLVYIAYHNDDGWKMNGYEGWTKDELIHRILDQEYPEVRPRPVL